jgi:alpha,alpha-trehalase
MALPKITNLSLQFKNKRSIDSELKDRAVLYVDDYWRRLRRFQKEDKGTLVGLPYPYVVPSAEETAFRFEEQYYWDSYFTAIGLRDVEYQPLVEGMLENLIHLFKRFGMIPNASRMYFTSRSQPPILTSFIFHVYDTYNKDVAWLKAHIAVAEEEYDKVWMNKVHPQWHNIYRGLSRYYDINVLHDLAETESGWDMTPRFERKCLDFLPVDLNSLLYKYETDFARAAEIYGDLKGAAEWKARAKSRKLAMDDLMWGKLRGFYFDYNYERRTLGDVWSLAAYYTMWVGMASPSQAERLVENLSKFEKSGGLTTTLRPIIDTSLLFGSLKAQWAYPNGWAPLHYIVVEGLRRYGYHDQAKRIAAKWVQTNLSWFDQKGVFLEKYNVVNPKKPPVGGVYPSQAGFGWTNAVLLHMISEFGL